MQPVLATFAAKASQLAQQYCVSVAGEMSLEKDEMWLELACNDNEHTRRGMRLLRSFSSLQTVDRSMVTLYRSSASGWKSLSTLLSLMPICIASHAHLKKWLAVVARLAVA